jgi:hypothetical protein
MKDEIAVIMTILYFLGKTGLTPGEVEARFSEIRGKVEQTRTK